MSDAAYLVVGGTSGIGASLVDRLDRVGNRVYVLSPSADPNQDSERVSHLRGDATDPDLSLDDLPETLQGLAYCPGSIRLRPFNRLTPDEFRADLELNLIGAVRTIQKVLTPLKRSRNGAAVVLFSTVAVQKGLPFHAAVAAAKGAVEGLVRALAAELAPRVRANAVAPSLTDTPLAAGLLADDAKRKAAGDRHPLGRIGTPAEVAEAAAYLLTPASGWITGQILHVDGGLSRI